MGVTTKNITGMHTGEEFHRAPRLHISPHAENLTLRNKLPQGGVPQGHDHPRGEGFNQGPEVLCPTVLEGLGGIGAVDVIPRRAAPQGIGNPELIPLQSSPSETIA